MVIEDFNNESLIFQPVSRKMIKINSVTRDILHCLNGKITTDELIHDMALVYDMTFDLLSKDVQNILSDLAKQCIVKDITPLSQVKDFNKMRDTKYSINPDISCRIEENDGALLFNPETDAVNVINPIGLAIWQSLEYPKCKKEIIEYLLDTCEDVPEDQVAQDVNDFIDKLQAAGFIGELIE